MKNFKKVLALVLAVVMLLSFATVASAKIVTSEFYEDVDDIDYKEAVDVLGAIGVLEGYPDDTFRPDNTITRAEAAKIIAMFDNGSSSINGLYASANPFSDCVGNWAESFIAYCAKTGIIAGMGGDKFAPSEKVTGVQFLKMVLVVLGYDAKAEGLEGKNWDVNTLALAKRVGLTATLGVKFDYSAYLKRQEAAVIMLDALRADTVVYGNALGANVSKLLAEIDKFEKTVEKTEGDYEKAFAGLNVNGIIYVTVVGAVKTGDKLMKDWDLEEGYTSDAFYRPYRTWTLDGVGTIGKYMFPVQAEYTTKFSECELLVDLGVAKTNVAPLDYNLIVNGAFNDRYTTAHTTVNHAPTGDCDALDVTLGGQGTLTQVFDIDEEIAKVLYDDEFDDGGYYVIEIETWLGQVKTAQKTTVNSDGHLVQGTEATVKVFTGTDVHTPATCERFYAPTQDAAVLKTTAKGLAEDDYVLVTYSDRNDGGFKPGIVDVDVVAPTNGKLTGYKWINYTSQTAVDGTYIPDSYHFHEDYTASKTSGNIGGTFGFIYDNYGNVIGMVDEVGLSTKYLVVDKMALTQENVYDAVVRANVVGLDAKTTEKVSVASIKLADLDGYDTWDVDDFASDFFNGFFFWSVLKDWIGDDLGTWTLDADGNYVIDLSVGERLLDGPYSITKGIPEVKDTAGAICGTDASTKYLIHENDGTYTSVTGYKNIDTLKAENVEIVDVNGDGVAEIVYLWGSIARAGDSFVAYVTYNVDEWRELVGTTKFYKGTVYVNGVATDICLDADDYNTLVANGSGFYKFNYTKVSADSESYAKIVAQGAELSLNDLYYGNSMYDDMFTAAKHGGTVENYALADDVVVYRITTKATVVKADNAKDYLETALSMHGYPDPVMHLGFNLYGQVNVIYVHEDPVS